MNSFEVTASVKQLKWIILKGKVKCACVSVQHVGGRLCVFKVCEEETSQLVSASISAFLKHPECSAGGDVLPVKKQQPKNKSILLRLYSSYLTNTLYCSYTVHNSSGTPRRYTQKGNLAKSVFNLETLPTKNVINNLKEHVEEDEKSLFLQRWIFRSEHKLREQLWPETVGLKQIRSQSVAQIAPYAVERKQWVVTSFFTPLSFKKRKAHSCALSVFSFRGRLRGHTDLLWRCRTLKRACLERATCLPSGIFGLKCHILL